MARRLLSFLTTTLFILLTGAVAGLVVAVLGLALRSALMSLQNSNSVGLLSFLVDLFFLLIDVLAVSTVAALDGIWTGLLVAAAISVTYGITLWLRPQQTASHPLSRKWLALLFAIVVAIVAPLSLQTLLAGYATAASVGGALFGLIIAFALNK